MSPAERMIRSMNLFPRKSGNIIRDDNDVFVPGKIVEKKFSLLADASVEELGHHAGYYSLPHTKAARMFYYFFENRNKSKDAPVVIWLTGGPGCGSEVALFYENGPFKISQNLSLEWNNYGWDKVSNLIYVDQPTGTGFSYSSDDSDLRHDEAGVSNDLYDFLQAFFKEYSQFANNDFYITGESYAGHYIPALASRIHQANKQKQGILINLKGFVIGNGLTNPGIQYAAYTDFALANHLITKKDFKDINTLLLPRCELFIKICATQGGDLCATAKIICGQVFQSILAAAGNNVNYYDIRKKCEGSLCYDFSNGEKLLNEKTVKKALGVSEDLEYVSCSTTVYGAMERDFMVNLEVGIPALLEDGIRFLAYVGEEDLICNWLGNIRWVRAMEWSGQKEFKEAPPVQFKVNGEEAGSLSSHGPLTFLKVYKAGHLVPMDQPEAALDMLTRWIQGKL
ncbi:Serine carboxypeptidase-like 48 [Stylosanthes scabra]|uniref:Carboxypeptidase n=1 Tax=Stylosanthes scabra TaxID=79078 RepID=A0ABU6ZF76_9FABA|nr:Serine carboxypeptidase-like 48 [Stylosanthes scabra]